MPQTLIPPTSAVLQRVTAPGAGNEWTFTVGANVIYQIVSIHYVYTAAVAPGNREVRIDINDPSVIYARFATSLVVTSGETIDVVWQPQGQQIDAINSLSHVNLLPPNVFIYPGFVISSVSANKNAADTYTGIELWFYQYLSPLTA